MAADYPGAVKNFLTLEDGVDTVLAQHMNERGDEITAIETELGINVAGSISDLVTRLAVVLENNGTLKADSVITTTIKTATAEVTNVGDGSRLYITLTGGEYCFFPKIKMSTADDKSYEAHIMDASQIGFTTYATKVGVRCTAGGTQYFTTRYVTSSGQDYWIWILINKSTKKVKSMSGAPDHVAYGNSNDFEKQPHPYDGFNPEKEDVILIEKDQARNIQKQAKEKNILVLELIEKEYEIDFDNIYDYKPIHSGQFSPDKKPILVKTIPDYVKVRKLKGRAS